MSRVTLKSLAADNARLREQLHTTEHLLAVANDTIARLTAPREQRKPAACRYWDEFSDRRAALLWAKEHCGRLIQRPRAES
jgi:hypothetical protein